MDYAHFLRMVAGIPPLEDVISDDTMPTLISLGKEALPRRSACLAATELREGTLSRLGAHVWSLGWQYFGFPEYRIGSLYITSSWLPPEALPTTFLLTTASLGDSKTNARAMGDPRFGLSDDGTQGVQLIPNTLAFECVWRNEPARLKKLSNDELSISVGNSTCYQGVTILHYAAALGSVDCLRVLIQRFGGGFTHVASTEKLLFCCDDRFPFGDRQGFLSLIFDSVKDAKVHSAGLQAVMDSAARFSSDQMISFLFDRFGDSFFDTNAPLLLASSQKPGTISVRLLLSHGADVEFSTESGWTSLIMASASGCRGIARLLLKYGANVNAKCEDGFTGLMRACREGHTKVARLLLEHGADVDARERLGATALILACQCGHIDCANLLLEHGADVNAKTEDGRTALMISAQKGQTDAIRLLLERGADVDATTQFGYTALLFTILEGRSDNALLECIRILLARGADVNAQNCDGATTLMFAAQFRLTETARLLLESGADVNLENGKNLTALMCASLQKDNNGLSRLLLEHGADVNFKNGDGATALLLATHDNLVSSVQLLLEHGADANLADVRGNTPLAIATSHNFLECARLLLKHGESNLFCYHSPGPKFGSQILGPKKLAGGSPDIRELPQHLHTYGP